MKLKRWLFGIFVVAVVVVTAVATNVNALSGPNNFSFSNFTADYYLTRNEDGSSNLHVKEILTAEFPDNNQNHGITRIIPRTNQSGANKVVTSENSLNLQVLRNGQPENIDDIQEGENIYTIYIGDPDEYVQGTQVYTLEYDFNDVITEFSSDGTNVSGQDDAVKAWQELYWDTNGTGWSQSFKQVTANLHFADDIKNHVSSETKCFVGKQGNNSTSRCETKKTTDGFTFSAENLAAGENLTYVVSFDPDTFTVKLDKNYSILVFLFIEILFGGSILAFCIIRWYRTARPQQKMYKDSFVAPEYLPPRDISVAEGSQLYLKKPKSIYVATLLEMAVQKKITIQNIDNQKWSVTLNLDPKNLIAPEHDMLKILAYRQPLEAGKSIVVEKHTATRTLANYALDYTKDARQLLVKKGYFVEKKAGFKMSTLGVIAIFIAIWVLIAVLITVGGPVFDWVEPSENAILVGGPVLAVFTILLFIGLIAAIIYFSNKTSTFGPFTEKGVKMAIYLEGLNRYIGLAENNRLDFLQSVKGADTSATGIVRLYEKLLPWACLFGVEQTWADELNRYYEAATQDPNDDRNRRYDPTLSPSLLHGIIAGNMVSQINNTLNHSTYYASSSSSSSGSSGGGFSGGGGGGGGGGGW